MYNFGQQCSTFRALVSSPPVSHNIPWSMQDVDWTLEPWNWTSGIGNRLQRQPILKWNAVSRVATLTASIRFEALELLARERGWPLARPFSLLLPNCWPRAVLSPSNNDGRVQPLQQCAFHPALRGHCLLSPVTLSSDQICA